MQVRAAWHMACTFAPFMPNAARIWPNLTQIALSFALSSACGSSHLPLGVDTDGATERPMGALPPLVAGSGFPSTTGTAGATAAWPGGTGIMNPQVTALCGNRVIESPSEACDGVNLNGATCFSLGYQGGGTLLCNPTTCTYDTIMCRMGSGWPVGSTEPDFTGEDAGVDDDAG